MSKGTLRVTQGFGQQDQLYHMQGQRTMNLGLLIQK